MAVDTASATSAMCLSQWRRTSERRFSLSVNWHNDKPLPTNAQHRATGYLAVRQILCRSQGSVADNPWYKKMCTRHSINLFYLFLWHVTRGIRQQKKKWIKGEKHENIVVSPDGSWLIGWLTTTVDCHTCINILEIITIRLWQQRMTKLNSTLPHRRQAGHYWVSCCCCSPLSHSCRLAV